MKVRYVGGALDGCADHIDFVTPSRRFLLDDGSDVTYERAGRDSQGVIVYAVHEVFGPHVTIQ